MTQAVVVSNSSNPSNSNEALISGGSSPSREVREILKESGSDFCDSNLEKDGYSSYLNDLNMSEFKNIDDDDEDEEDEENNEGRWFKIGAESLRQGLGPYT